MNVHDAEWYLKIGKLRNDQVAKISKYIESINFDEMLSFYNSLPKHQAFMYGSMDKFGIYEYKPSINDLRTEVIRLAIIILTEKKDTVKGRFNMVLNDFAGTFGLFFECCVQIG